MGDKVCTPAPFIGIKSHGVKLDKSVRTKWSRGRLSVRAVKLGTELELALCCVSSLTRAQIWFTTLPAGGTIHVQYPRRGEADKILSG